MTLAKEVTANLPSLEHIEVNHFENVGLHTALLNMRTGSLLCALVALALANAVVAKELDLNAILSVEKEIDGMVDDLQWVGDDRKTVFLRTQFNTLYRSKNEGRVWTEEMEQLDGVFEEAGNGRGSGVVDIIPSPVDRNRVFLLGAGQTHWVTRDLGETYEKVEAEIDIHEVRFHPTEVDWLLASHLTPGCFKKPSAPRSKKSKKKPSESNDCFTEVFLSQDYGKSFHSLNSYVVQFGWGAIDGASRDTIFMTEFAEKSGSQTYGVWDERVNFVRSDDLWAHSATVIPHGNRFLAMGDYLFVAMVEDGNGADAEVSLQISRDNGASFALANVPSRLSEHSYTIVDTSEGTVFLHVNHGPFESKYGQLYVSDASGVNYVKSLSNALRSGTGRVDLERVLGVEGIYIANYVDNTGDIERALDEEKSAPKKVIRTAITFDKGGEWHHLMPPSKNAEGEKIKCEWKGKKKGQECTLHLHGVTDSWGPFYSVDSAIGIVMATGNTGPALSNRADQVNTYLSRDAGLTWEEVRAGSHIYDIGDHGGLIVMAPNTKATDKLYFSWDQGETGWTEYIFTKSEMEVENIIIEPTSTSLVFIIYGTRNGGEDYVAVHVDFSLLQQKQCKGEANPDDPESDYETWSPHDGRITSGRCLMGRRVDYVRRKRDSQCFNGVDKEFVHAPSSCECVPEDWECDYGYSRPFNDPSAECTPVDSSTTTPTFADLCASVAGGSVVYRTKGYRRVAGDTCQGGYMVVAPEEYVCPSFLMGLLTGHGFSGGGMGVLILMSIIVVGIGAATYMSRESIIRAGKALPWFNNFKYQDLSYRPDTAVEDDYFDDEEPEEAAVLNEPNLLDQYTDNSDEFGKRFGEQSVPVIPSPANN